MISRFRDFIKISFVRDVGILQVGNLFSVFFGIVGSIILARLLHPELYGFYALIFAFIGLIGVFMNWGGDYAGLTLLAEAYAKKDKREIKNVLTYFLKITLLAIGIIGILSIVLAPFLTEFLYHNGQIGSWARIVLLAGFLAIVYDMLIVVLQSSRKIKQLTILETFNKFLYTSLPIIFVLLGFGLLGVVWGYLVSAFIFLIFAIFIYSFLVKKDKLLPSFKQIFSNFKKIKLKKYFNFGFLIAINKNLGILISLLPVMLLGFFTASYEVSYFKIAFGYITVPLMFLGPISRLLAVQLPRSKTYGFKLLRKHFYKTSLFSGLISALLVIPFIVFAPYLIRLFYGMEYISSIPLVYLLAIFSIISGFTVGIGSIYRTLDKMKIAIITNISQIILMLLLVLFLVKIYTPLISVILALIICSVIFSLLHFYIIEIIFKKGEYR
jgi:O-antigen/teichoic acid export membrane protein